VPLPKSHPRPRKFVAAEKRRSGIKKSSKASLNEDFMSLFSTHPYFRNSAEEFHPHETLSTPMRLLASLSSLIWCHINIINAHETLMKPH
jgi:hypothetical protein